MKLGFDSSKVDPAGRFDPLPAGEYNVVFTNTIEKPTKAGTGSYLELTMQVIDGDYEGRLLWDRLNLNNPNETAVSIAEQRLSQICHAVDISTIEDSEELEGLTARVKVVIRSSEKYGDSNDIKKYMACEVEYETQDDDMEADDEEDTQEESGEVEGPCDEAPEGVEHCGVCTDTECTSSPAYKKPRKAKKAKKGKKKADQWDDL